MKTFFGLLTAVFLLAVGSMYLASDLAEKTGPGVASYPSAKPKIAARVLKGAHARFGVHGQQELRAVRDNEGGRFKRLGGEIDLEGVSRDGFLEVKPGSSH